MTVGVIFAVLGRILTQLVVAEFEELDRDASLAAMDVSLELNL